MANGSHPGALNGLQVLTMAHTSLGSRINHEAKGCSSPRVIVWPGQVLTMAHTSLGTHTNPDASGCYSNVPLTLS